MFAKCKITAKEFCIACFHAAMAGTPGHDFGRYGMAPDQSSDGAYQRHLDTVLPECHPPYVVDTPALLKASGTRRVIKTPVMPPHESIAAEVRAQPGILEQNDTTQWPPAYDKHPVVQRAARHGARKPLPLVIYLDGVRFTSVQAGRVDSILGVWCYNLVTKKRHLVSCMSGYKEHLSLIHI